ncbi:MAG: glycogen debranching protein [Bacteroidales bacterium]|nr:glycogen debranching protein [Bacteroidales bacterium]
MKHLLPLLASSAVLPAAAQVIVSTDAYTWHGDTITQGIFTATAPDPYRIESNYYAQPGYGFGIDHEWKLKNDISGYPQLTTPNNLHTAIYNMGLDEMVNAVEPDTTLRTGREWAGVWTRDVSYSILLSMAYMQPEASRISLMKKVNPRGEIIQDTGSGGAWPVSSDRMIWALAAYELYKVTGDRQWLEYIYPIIQRSLRSDSLTVRTEGGLVKGETSFIDWREQSYPKWMQTADIYNSEALSTSVVQAAALRALADMATDLGHKDKAKEYAAEADRISEAVNRDLWMADKGYYAMYNYGRTAPVLNPRAETLGESLAILWDVADADRARTITENNPTTPFGAPVFFPQISDMPAYHNNALWPWVAAYWALANAKAGNEEGTLEAIGSIFRPAALFATNKENLNLDNGDIATELNSSNMLWCLAGNIAVTHKILFGINFEKNGLAFRPFVPKALGAERTLTGFRYRDAVLNITVKGYGDRIASFTLNGKEHKPFIPADIKGENNIVITMADNDIAPLRVNRTRNVKAPLTPIARLNGTTLEWNPIEYIGHYVVLRDGVRVATTRQTSFDASVPGEYQVIGVSGDGVESFASEPLSTRGRTVLQLPDETTAMVSPEVSYQPSAPVEGYTGAGFFEVDRASAPITIPVDLPEGGRYAISVRYANGNGPVNTENKCAIRTLSVDGRRLGILVMPHRGVGNWYDWGASNTVITHLPAGTHNLTIDFRPENNNMNIATNHALIDCVNIEYLGQ